MKRTWLTAVSVAGVLGTGSAAVMAGAAINAASTAPTNAPVPDISVPRNAVYQVGAAARIEVSDSSGVLSIVSTTVGMGWTAVSTSAPGATASVVLTDGTQLVTFTASTVAGAVHATVTSALVAAPDTTAPAIVSQDPGVVTLEPIPAIPPAVAASGTQAIGGASTTGASDSEQQSKLGTSSHHNDDDNESEDEGSDGNDD